VSADDLADVLFGPVGDGVDRGAAGGFEAVRDFDASSKDRFVQSKDKASSPGSRLPRT